MSKKPKEKKGSVLLEPAKDFVRISHYGCGKYATSPVVLELPPTIQNGASLVAPLGFALDFREAYLGISTPAQRQDLNSRMREIVATYSTSLDRYEAHLGYLQAYWRSENLTGYNELPQKSKGEDELQDKLGYLIALSDFGTRSAARYNSIYTTWMDELRIFHRRRALLDSTALTLASTGATATFALAADPAHALWFAPVLFFMRFSKPFNSVAEGSFLQLRAYEYLKGDKKAKRAFAKAMAAGMTDEDIILTVRDSLVDAMVGAEARMLSDTISRELAALPEPETESTRLTSPLLALQVQDHLASHEHWDLINAQRALLAELRSS